MKIEDKMSFSEKEILAKIELARQYYANNKFSEAISLYEELNDILMDDSDNLPVIQIELGWSYYNNQEYQKAISFLRKALSSKKITVQQAFDCTRLIGFSEELEGNRKEAIHSLNKALDMDISENIKRFTYFELGKIYFLDGQVIEAEDHLKSAAALFSEKEKDYQLALAYYQGFTAYFLKKFEKSRDHFDYIIHNSDDYKTKAGGYFGLAHLHYHRKEYPVLIDLCEKVMRLDESFYDKETLGFFLCESYYHMESWSNLENLSGELMEQYPDGRYAGEYEKYDYAVKNQRLVSPAK
jgi:tetratricopeptide (TPR) repeat protein